MSLAQVAGGDFSRAFLHQVETGKAGPSTRVLRVIAERLGTHVEYLFGTEPPEQIEIAVERARIALLLGNPAKALDLLRPVLDSSAWPAGSDARLAAAEALRRLGRRAESEELLRREELAVRRSGDRHRLRWLRAIRRGDRYRPSSRELIGMAEEAEREGKLKLAAELYRTARILLTGPAGRYRRAADRSPEE